MSGVAGDVLLVDDDKDNRDLLAEALTKCGYSIKVASSGEEACRLAGEQAFSVVISDIQMGPVSGMQLLKWLRSECPDIPIILLTAFGSVETAINAMKHGAFDYLTKPINLEEFVLVVKRALRHHELVCENQMLKTAFDQRLRLNSIVARSRAMVEIFKLVGKTAPTKASVLIYGETGTGKELIARALHDNSARASHPFVAINCGGMPDSLLESELFGYVKGAFTNAIHPRRGLIEESSGGSLFLDEVSDLSASGQAKLLRVLQEGEIRRLGSNTNIKVDLRVIAASRKNLESLVKLGTFREDLLYRLKTVTIEVPPLRERKEDITSLIELFLARCGSANGIRGFSPKAMEILLDYDWPGNVRELEHVVERTCTLGNGPILQESDLPGELGRTATAEDLDSTEESPIAAARRRTALISREQLIEELNKAGGMKARAAETFGISRWALNRLLEKHGLAGVSDD
jgi:DNA-binding NtrC family response regulator